MTDKQLEALQDEMYIKKDNGSIHLSVYPGNPNYQAIREFFDELNNKKKTS